jgi:hypothetical protein
MRLYYLALVGVLSLNSAQLLFAQTTGTISGAVTDETAAALPGVEMTATHVDTGITRTVVSDDVGRYRITNLNVGSYEIVASLPGFQSGVRSGLSLTMGREAVVDFTLRVGEITERVQVIGEASLVETTSSSLGSLVDRKTILDLPLNGRDLTTLISLQPGATRSTTGSTGGSAGFSRDVSISGARPSHSAFLLDGTEVKSIDGGLPAGVSGNFLGGEAVQEFKVERNAYSAEYGGSGGGAINVLSKAGSNIYHGSLYYFHRNDNLDAAEFRAGTVVDSSGAFAGKIKPEFKRHQYGFSAGGPIITNRTFFFGNYEGLREGRGFTSTLRTLTAAARNGDLPSGQVQVLPGMVPYLALWPLPGPGAIDQGNGTTREAVGRVQPTQEDFYQVRVDHNFSDADSVFARVTRQDSERIPPGTLRWDKRQWTYNTFITLEEKKIISPTLLNTLRFSFNRRGLAEEDIETDPVDPSLLFVPADKWPLRVPQTLGIVSVDDLSTLGSDRGLFDRLVNYFQLGEDLVYLRGAHSLKAGFSFRRIQLNGDSNSRKAGDFSFGPIENLLRGEPETWRGEFLPEGIGIRGFRWSLWGWYLQDDWKVHPQLTLNLGFRHEFYTVPTEVNGRIANLKNPFTDTVQAIAENTDSSIVGTTLTQWFENPSLKSFMPRIGLAWDPTGDGKMAIRAGGGIFYNHIQPQLFRQTAFRGAPFTLQTRLTGDAPGDIPFIGIYDFIVNQGEGESEIYAFPFDWGRNPHMLQWNLNIQREILPQTALTVGYAGSRGLNLMDIQNLNVAEAENVNGRYVFAADAERRNTFYDLQLRSLESSISSWYHSFQAGLQRRFQAGWQLQLSYTHSRTQDQSSQVSSAFRNDSGGVNYYPDPMMRWSLAAFHLADNFSGSWVWLLPVGPGQQFGADWTGVAGKILGGWQLSGILTLASGPPATVGTSTPRALTRLKFGSQGPDLAPGGDLSPVTGDPDQYFDVSNFVFAPSRTIGNVGRNTLKAPGVANLDFSLTKNTEVSEQATLQFRAEFFNLLNRPNFSLPATRVFGSTGKPSSSAGFISGTTTTSRQIQFGLRLEF